MFTKTARFYDAIYSFKDYVRESELVYESIQMHRPNGSQTLLDVACGTGKHLSQFSKWFEAYGVDLDPELLKIASEAAPNARLSEGDMRTFDLGFLVDVVTCLFSSVAYMSNLDDLRAAISNMARHLKPGGLLIIEPFLYPESYSAGHLSLLSVDEPDMKVARMSRSEQEGQVAILNFQYLIGTSEGVFHETEHHRLGLFAQSEYQDVMESCRLIVDYDPVGPMGRGLFAGIKA